jgi:hypothetical protein
VYVAKAGMVRVESPWFGGGCLCLCRVLNAR